MNAISMVIVLIIGIIVAICLTSCLKVAKDTDTQLSNMLDERFQLNKERRDLQEANRIDKQELQKQIEALSTILDTVLEIQRSTLHNTTRVYENIERVQNDIENLHLEVDKLLVKDMAEENTSNISVDL